MIKLKKIINVMLFLGLLILQQSYLNAKDNESKFEDKIDFSGFIRYTGGFLNNLPDDMHNVISDRSKHDISFFNSIGFSRLRFAIDGFKYNDYDIKGFLDFDFRGSAGDAASPRIRQAWVGIGRSNSWSLFIGQKESISNSMLSFKYTLNLEGNIGAGTLYQRSPAIQFYKYFRNTMFAVEITKSSDAGPGTGKLNHNYSNQPTFALSSYYNNKLLKGRLSYRFDNSRESFDQVNLGKFKNNSGYLINGEGEINIGSNSLYVTGYYGYGSAYPHIFRSVYDDGGPLGNLTLINSKHDQTRGFMVGAKKIYKKITFVFSFANIKVNDGDNSWSKYVGYDTKNKYLMQETVKGYAKYTLNQSLWIGIEYIGSNLTGLDETSNYKGTSFLLHTNLNF